MSQFNGGNFGGIIDSFANLSPEQRRLMQMSMNMSETLPQDEQKRSQLFNLLGLGSNLRFMPTSGQMDTDFGGLGGLLQYLA